MAMVRLGYVKGNRMSNLQTKNIKLRERAVGIVQDECNVDAAKAQTVLEAADWKLPVALVMQQANVNREAAEAALAKTNQLVAQAVLELKS
ncbi:MAG TPA: N-acetylmuramic acid 6-phosphate etherase, partial [Blastocatellia bacterium]|nr:N-acetylmuramic acid 6-phosphate etherase [Blastocatellia bacterium]